MKNELVSEIQGVVDLIQDFRSEALLPVFEAVTSSLPGTVSSFGRNSIFRIPHASVRLSDTSPRRSSSLTSTGYS